MRVRCDHGGLVMLLGFALALVVMQGGAFAQPAPAPESTPTVVTPTDPAAKMETRLGEIETLLKSLVSEVKQGNLNIENRLARPAGRTLQNVLAKFRLDINGLAMKNSQILNPRKSAKISVDAQPANASSFFLPGKATNDARRLHVIVYSYADDPAIGTGTIANEEFLVSLAQKMKSFFPATEQDRVNIIAKRNFTESSIAADVAQIPDVQSSDVIFCYMSTHGTYSQTTGHAVLMTDGNTVVPRSNLFKILKSRNARLTVFVTDSCANFADGAAGFPIARTHPAAIPSYSLYYLLFQFVGNLNMNGASPDPSHVNADDSLGEEGFYLTNTSTQGGGIFTRAFVKEAIFGTNQDWVQFFTACQRATLIEGQAVPTPAQTPGIFNENGFWVE